MKKYVKPDLYFESFALSHSVASGCAYALNHTENGCRLDGSNPLGLPDGVYLFAGTDGGCTLYYSDASYEDYCLQTDADGYNIFTS